MTYNIGYYGVNSEDENIDKYNKLSGAKSLFDYDIVVINPDIILDKYKDQTKNDTYVTIEEAYQVISRNNKRIEEETKFLLEKGGLMICYLRPVRGIKKVRIRMGRDILFDYINNYDWLPVQVRSDRNISDYITYGKGTRINPTVNENNPFLRYLKLKETYWNAYFSDINQIENDKNCLGSNEANKCVSLEIQIGKGKIVFIPLSNHPKKSRIISQNAIKYLDQIRGGNTITPG